MRRSGISWGRSCHDFFLSPGVDGAICTHDLSQERQSSSTVGLWRAFSGCVVRVISINVFMIFIYLNIFIRG